MKAILTLLVASVFLLVGLTASARCYTGSNWKKDADINYTYVCVKGDDDFADRRKAVAVCSKVLDKKCDDISSISYSCNGNCYDEDGNLHNSLSNY